MEERLNKSELIMTAATVVMTFATLVMMYSGCQQTRIAESMEKTAKHDEQTRLVGAKREVQRAWFQVATAMTPEGGCGHWKTKSDCQKYARKVYDLMDITDNYFLVQYPELAAKWAELRGYFGAVAMPFENQGVVLWGTNYYRGAELPDSVAVEMLQKACDRFKPEFFAMHDTLDLNTLVPPNPKKRGTSTNH